MLRLLLVLLVALAGVASCKGGEVVKKVAAYEVPTSSEAERAQLLAVMQRYAGRSGFHVDHATDEELAVQSEVRPIKFNAAVWAGANDDEYVASAMSQPSGSERVWLSFAVGRNPDQTDRFRLSLMEEARNLWPETKELPLLNGETIPLPADLIVDGDKYVLNPAAADRYNVPEGRATEPRPSL